MKSHCSLCPLVAFLEFLPNICHLNAANNYGRVKMTDLTLASGKSIREASSGQAKNRVGSNQLRASVTRIGNTGANQELPVIWVHCSLGIQDIARVGA